MKKFIIYQLFVGAFGKENHFIVCKNEAENEDESIAKYLEEMHPNDKSQQDFVKGYLQSDEVSDKAFELVSQDDIDDNRKKLGAWI